MKSGIYQITCLKNNKIYIGSAVNLQYRWKRHLAELRNSYHHNIILQNAFNLYGIESFKFEVLEYVDKDKLLNREKYFLNEKNPFGDNGFNIKKTCTGGNNFTFHPNKEAIFKKISDSRLKKKIKLTQKEKDNISKKLIEFYSVNPSKTKGKKYEEIYGTERALEIKKKISKNNATKKGDKNPFYGKTHSDDFKKKLSKLQEGRYLGVQNIPITINGIEYRSYGLAAKKFKTSPAVIRHRCLSKNLKYSNYKLKNEKK